MDTRTGEIFERGRRGELLPDAYDTQREFERAQQRMAMAQARNELVPVSERVARQQRIGQRVEERRRKRKAAKAARRTNRRAKN